MRDLVALAGARLGWTPGQAWTVVPGLALSVPVLLATVVGVLGQPAAPSGPAVPALPGAVLAAPALPVAPPAAGPPPAALPPAVLAPAPAGGPAAPPEVPAEVPPPAAAADVPPAPGAPAAPAPGPRSSSPAGAADPDPAVADSGWSSRLGADPTVPGGTLPVQAGPTGEQSRAFLRLTTPVRRLRLPLDPTPGSSYGEAVAGVRACQNRDAGWASGGGQQPAAAPEVDPARCARGVRDGDVVVFDLSALPDVVGAGLSLLPDPAGPAPTRLVFRTLLEDA